MDIYLVGGAVRDTLLNRPIKERDWVVVGASVEQMLKKGYTQVGKDFPVFLHPETKEEYALARTERKTGHGYGGFSFDTNQTVSLEEDLKRRDLTINAMAMDTKGNLIDPYHGKEDLEQKILRHVSPAFNEDPLRVLRLARFAARFYSLGFKIAPETMDLLKDMSLSGELSHLVPERVWLEIEKVLTENKPSVFFEVLKKTGACSILFPELSQLEGKPNPVKWHPEVDSWLHTMMVLDQSAKLSSKPTVRFAALLHDLGKGITDLDILPKHTGHEAAGVPLVKAVCDRLRTPKEYKQLAMITAEYHLHIHRAFEIKPQTILKVLKLTDAYRRPERFTDFLLSCEADSRGRIGYENSEYPQSDLFQKALELTKDIPSKSFIEQGLQGKAIAEAIYQKRLQIIKSLCIQDGGS